MAQIHPGLKTPKEPSKIDEREISPEFKEELRKVRNEVKSGKYVVYKTLEDLRKDISK